MDLETLESLSEHDDHRNGSGYSEPTADTESVDERYETVDDAGGTPDDDANGDAASEVEGLDSIVESLLLAAGAPVALSRLVEALDGPSKREVSAALAVLAARYERDNRGLRLIEVAGAFQLRTAPQHGPFVRRLLGGKPPRLSRPMLETLAIVAYRQPCTRPEIEAIRGVDCDAVVSTLLERKLLRMLGRKEAPGRPVLYGTTRDFLEVFGLPDLRALPPLRDIGDGIELLMAQDLQVGPNGMKPTEAAAVETSGEAAAEGAGEALQVEDAGDELVSAGEVAAESAGEALHVEEVVSAGEETEEPSGDEDGYATSDDSAETELETSGETNLDASSEPAAELSDETPLDTVELDDAPEAEATAADDTPSIADHVFFGRNDDAASEQVEEPEAASEDARPPHIAFGQASQNDDNNDDLDDDPDTEAERYGD